MGFARADWPYCPQGSCIDVKNGTIECKVAETEYGVLAGGYRPPDEDNTYWRFANFLFPFWTQPPPCAFGPEAVAPARVPPDETPTMLFALSTHTYIIAMGPRAPRPPSTPVGM